MSAYIPARLIQLPQSVGSAPRGDSIRPTQLYVESEHNVSAGHIVSWTGDPAMFDKQGNRLNSWTAQSGHEFALSKVEANTLSRHPGVAGVVLETAAEPDAVSFTHKGIHTNHLIKDADHILRVATKGSVVLAWVLDDHQNALEGVYTKNINGVASGTVVVRELGDHFTITESNPNTVSISDELAALTARFNELVNPSS